LNSLVCAIEVCVLWSNAFEKLPESKRDVVVMNVTVSQCPQQSSCCNTPVWVQQLGMLPQQL
jgi:hypothetical protein